jgi:hypothetical protein
LYGNVHVEFGGHVVPGVPGRVTVTLPAPFKPSSLPVERVSVPVCSALPSDVYPDEAL